MKNRPSEKFWNTLGRIILTSIMIGLIILCILFTAIIELFLISIGCVTIVLFLFYISMCTEDFIERYPYYENGYGCEINPKYNIIWKISKFLDRNYEK